MNSAAAFPVRAAAVFLDLRRGSGDDTLRVTTPGREERYMIKRILSRFFSLFFPHDFTPGGPPLFPDEPEQLPEEGFWQALPHWPPNVYSGAIAHAAAVLSEGAETGDGGDITAKYRACGFSPDCIAVGNYRRNTGSAPDVGSGKPSLAFCIGHRPLEEDTSLLVLTARGAVNLWELYRALTTEAVCGFSGLSVYDVIDEFANELQWGLERYLALHRELSGQRLLLLLTGHSLGGAAVNLLAARLLVCPPTWTEQPEIFCYTFGAIDVFDASKAESSPVSKGFEAIHNIYNEQDDFGPIGHGLYGIPLLMAKGNHKSGKFGQLYTFDADYRGRRKSSSPNHDMCVYRAALRHPLERH